MKALAPPREWAASLLERHGRLTLLILALIVAVGLALRVDRVIHPLDRPGDDALAYYAISKALYEDGTYGPPSMENASDWSPGAPLLYAGAFFLSGSDREGVARIVIALLGTLAIVVVYLLATRLNCRPAGLVAAGAVAVYPSFVHTTGALLSEPPAILTLPAAILGLLWAADRPVAWRWAVPGLLLGLTALIRPEYLLVAAALAAAAFVMLARERGWKPGLAATAALVCAFLVPVLPWTIRNLIELDRFVPLSTGSGKALYVGSYLPADGDYQRVKAILAERYLGRRLEPGSAALDRVDPTPLFDRVAARHPDLPRDSALAKIGKDRMLDFIGERPLDYLAMLARKVGRMWSTGVGPAMDSVLGRIAQLLALALALAGAVVLATRRRWWELATIAIPIAVLTGIGAITLASNRRNEILMTLVFCLAGVALARGFAGARDRIRSRGAPIL